MKRILRTKNWQLFSLIVLPNMFSYTSKIRLLLDILLISLLSTWSIAIIHYGNKYNKGLIVKNTSFYFSYLLLLGIYISSFFLEYYNLTPQNSNEIILLFVLITVSVINIVNIIRLNAKTIVSIELNKSELKINDWQNTFFQILFFVIGIWYVQPRINKIFSKEKDNQLA